MALFFREIRSIVSYDLFGQQWKIAELLSKATKYVPQPLIMATNEPVKFIVIGRLNINYLSAFEQFGIVVELLVSLQ